MNQYFDSYSATVENIGTFYDKVYVELGSMCILSAKTLR